MKRFKTLLFCCRSETCMYWCITVHYCVYIGTRRVCTAV